MSPINFSIIGCGHIAKKHIEAIIANKRSRLVALCDTNREVLDQYTSLYSVKGYTSVEDMLNDESINIDVVNICTPSGIHTDLAVKVAKAKKHVIVEKPMALTLKDADTIIQVCKENNVKLAVVHPNRFRPAIMEMKNYMNNERFGKLSHINATVRWNRNQAYYDQASWRGTKAFDGGVLMNQAIHNLDLLIWMGGEIEKVCGFITTRFRSIESEDAAVANIVFKSGALGVIEAATTIYPKSLEESLAVFGEKGTAIVSGITANHIKHWNFEGVPSIDIETLNKEIGKDPMEISGHRYIIEDMILSIEQDKEPVVTGKDGRDALKLVLAIYESAETGKVVNWEEIN